MKKALFFTKQQVELPPSYNFHTKQTGHIRPSLPDEANMQTRTTNKKEKELWSLLKEPFALVGKVIKDCFISFSIELCQFAPDVTRRTPRVNSHDVAIVSSRG
jgi:hypothetical protein